MILCQCYSLTIAGNEANVNYFIPNNDGLFNQVDAIAYYSKKEKDLLEKVSKQAELMPERPLGIAFVTLQTEAMAKL